MAYTFWGYCRYLVSAPWLRVKTTISHIAKLSFVRSALCGTEDTAATKRSLAAAGTKLCFGGLGSPSVRRAAHGGRAAPGPGSRSTVPGWGPGRAARCERSPALLLGATPSHSRCGAASSPAGCAPPDRPRPPPAATAAPAAPARPGPWRQAPGAEQRAGAVLARREGREGRQTPALPRAVQRGCARGPRAALTLSASGNGRALGPAQHGGERGLGFLVPLRGTANSEKRLSNTGTSLWDAANALGALENGREAGRDRKSCGRTAVGSVNIGSLESWGFYMASNFHMLFSIKLQRHIKP